MEAPTNTAAQVNELLYDGADLVVAFEDGRAPETVKVRKIPRKDFQQLATRWLSEEGECAFYLDRDPSFAEALTEESFDAVMQEGRRLNFTRFSNWLRRQMQKMDLMTLDAATGAAMKQAMETLAPLIQTKSDGSTSS